MSLRHAITTAKSLLSCGVTEDRINFAVEFTLRYPDYQDIGFAELKAALLLPEKKKEVTIKYLEGENRGIEEPCSEDIENGAFWQRYRRFLQENKNFSEEIIDGISTSTNLIISKLFSPKHINEGIEKKGLVVGDVQSGKTSNYTGLICKAADAGFNFIIVLAGGHNDLRSQTQMRLDEGFVGYDTGSGMASGQVWKNDFGVSRFGVGDRYIVHALTTCESKGDFNKNSQLSSACNFHTQHPILLVCKKNGSVLKNLTTWLQSRLAQDSRFSEKTLLIVDDEADYASINTKKEDEKPSTINQRILDLIALFTKSAYVGYTATPYANFFSPVEDKSLFPKDFIIKIYPPDYYIGADKIFGTSRQSYNQRAELLPILFPVEDTEPLLDSNKKVKTLPHSLRNAIRCFIISCALRIHRGDGSRHNSMLIHGSRLIAKHRSLSNMVVQELADCHRGIKQNIESVLEEFHLLYVRDDADYQSYVSITQQFLSDSFKEYRAGIQTCSWDEVKPLLYEASEKICVQLINGEGKGPLDYHRYEAEGLHVIAIGGDKLSRGLTLEGLSISYFFRESPNYDTLMQMGRWFGYKNGYLDLCRLFIPSQICEWYSHIALVDNELAEEFEHLANRHCTPENYAIKVREHPGRLRITNLTKMRNAETITVSWAGQLKESYRFSKDAQIMKNHAQQARHFFELLLNTARPEKIKVHYLWRNVDVSSVLEFFTNYEQGDQANQCEMQEICAYIRARKADAELRQWSVVLMGKESEKEIRFAVSNEVNVGCFIRRHDKKVSETTYYHLIKNHILNDAQDEFLDLDENILSSAMTETRKRDPHYSQNYPSPKLVRTEFRAPENPLLLIYPLNPEGAGANCNVKDIPFIGFAIAFPSTKSNLAENYSINKNLVPTN